VRIGQVIVPHGIVLAPMAGVTNRPFRLLAKEQGCELMFTEMVSAKAILHGNPKTMRMVQFDDAERPIGIQLFGSDPDSMAAAAARLMEFGPDLIDINMGCPVPKIVRNGEGAALMRDLKRAGEIVAAVKKAVPVPVTVKMRKGWDDASVNAVELAKVCEDAGCDAITVHGRTREQFYSGSADWNIIAEVKQAVSVPVIGNGDVFTAGDAQRLLQLTGCDGIMVARGALGNPWVFREIKALLVHGEVLPPPTIEEKVKGALCLLEKLVEWKGEPVAVREMRKHAAWYVKGLPGAAALRRRIYQAATAQEMRRLLEEYGRGEAYVHGDNAGC